MSLQWELTDVMDSDTLCWDERPDGKYQLKELTETIINFTTLVGINKITTKLQTGESSLELLNEPT